MYYPEEVIEEVRMRSDIVDVISGYVKLQKKGSNLFGLCPFHHEKSPSFSVSPSKQMYHCFGCGVSGNVITFVMEYENYSFREAVEMLADRSGVKLPKMEYSKEAKAKADRKAALLEINKLAANYFYYQLKQPQGKIGYDYLVKRKLTDETIRRFGLGFSNKISDDLYRYLKSKGYEDELLKDTGLVTIEERGARCHNSTSLMELTLSHDVSSACCDEVFCCDNLNNARHLLSFLSMDSQNLCMMGNLRLNDSCI